MPKDLLLTEDGHLRFTSTVMLPGVGSATADGFLLRI